MNACVVIATYNERENIERILDEVLRSAPGVDIVVVDDDSPDRTWELVEAKARADQRVQLLRRTGPRGRGAAMVAGLGWALERGAEAVVEMDADFSHAPARIPALLAELEQCDVVLGSRFVPGGLDIDRGLCRRMVSRLARAYLKILFGYRVADPTSGFRAFRAEALERIDFSSMRSRGVFAVTESLSRCHRAGLEICEVPIEFIDRRRGRSKLGGGTLVWCLVQARRQAWLVRSWRPGNDASP